MKTPKDTTYFPHDSNAGDDPKTMLLIAQLGLEAYGAYWILIEYLRQQPEYKAPLALIDPLARRYGSSKEKFEVIIKSYGLFEYTDEVFYSPSLVNRMLILEQKREMQRQKAEKRWAKDAAALPRHCHGITTAMQVKNSKVKNRIVKNSIEKDSKEKDNRNTVPPLFDWIELYCKERNNSVDARKFFDFYQSKGWKIGKEKMKDWQAAVRTWEQRSSAQENVERPIFYK